MTINPYSLPNPNDHGRYFTDDITLLPVGIIWQSMRGQPVFVGALVFVYFVIRKLLRQRMPASYGTHYPPQLTATSPEDLPEDIVQALAPFQDDCQAAGMEHLGYFLPKWIGGKRGVLSISIDPQRMAWSTATWLEIRVGEFCKSRVVFACHSETVDGKQLNTSLETTELSIPQMIPPGVQLNQIPGDSTVAQIIGHHNQTIAERTDIAVFDPASLIAHIEQRSLEQFDFMLSKGFYAELTPEEIDRLQRTN